MNVHGVKPGDRVLMVGSGNIGLIVSYQLIQAHVEVVALVEAAGCIGGYLVHAAKLRRAGVPILTSHTIVRALGEETVCGAVVAQVDQSWQVKPGSEREVACDVICLAVGLTPLVDMMWQAGCEMSTCRPWADMFRSEMKTCALRTLPCMSRAMRAAWKRPAQP